MQLRWYSDGSIRWMRFLLTRYLENDYLVYAEALSHQSLQAWLVEQVVGQLLVGKHRKCSAFGASSQFCGFLQRQAGVLANYRHHHAHHHLQAADFPAFIFFMLALPFAVG